MKHSSLFKGICNPRNHHLQQQILHSSLFTLHFKCCLLLASIFLLGANASAQGIYTENNILQKPNLKILHLGNSFTFDTQSYLAFLLNSNQSDVSDMCIYRFMRAAASFKEWYDIYHDSDFAAGYELEKICGGIDANVEPGKAAKGDGTLLRKALGEEQWDIIFLQPSSNYSPYYDQWSGHGDGGYLDELLALLKSLQPNAVIGMVLPHSSSSTYAGNAEHSSFERWRLNAQSVKRFCNDYGISLVVPYGTAVQNLRASSLNNDVDLTCDGLHCELVLCRYTASCCYYEAIIAPRTGVSVAGDKTRIPTSWFTSTTKMVSVDDETAPIAQKAALLAMKDWYTCNNPENFDMDLNPNVNPNLRADVNGDGAVDVADIATVIDIMAGAPLPSEGIGGGYADANGDGAVDVADIATIIDVMAGKS